MAERGAPISDAELELLKVLWASGPGTVSDVIRELKALRKKRAPAYTTVQTLLGRLVRKGFVTTEKSGRAFVFAPAVKQDELIGRELQDVADRVCDGLATPLMLALVERHRFSQEDVQAMRAMLDRMERESGGGR